MTADLKALTGIEVPTGLLIGGEWGKGSASFPVLDPATEEPLASVPDATVADALEAVTAAQRALPAWAATPPRQRAPGLGADDRTGRAARQADERRER
jgi:succinate-semialdehyde dehydrogenase / glutarate-semialdehyde dehydrogenase